MATVLEEVDRRSKLALSNQMEMLIFGLSDEQLYGINVFKIIEIVECPKALTHIPSSHASVKGVLDFRGKGITVIDLGAFLGMEPLDTENSICYIIVCEYNNATNGFLIKYPDRLETKGWDEIKNPTGILANASYLTAITYIDDATKTVQILDIEGVLAEVLGMETAVKSMPESGGSYIGINVLVADDSRTARASIQSVLTQMGIRHTATDSAISALDALSKCNGRMADEAGRFNLIISDIEMPGMDGFTFVRTIRDTPEYKGLYVMLHSSLSNDSNREKAALVGADEFIAKFQPDLLADKIMRVSRKLLG